MASSSFAAGAAATAAPPLPASLDYPRIKLLAVGGVGVGKSCVIKRYCEGRFVAKYIPTIGIDFGVKKVDVNKAAVMQHRQSAGTAAALSASSAIPAAVRVNFWDGSGDDDYREIRNEFYDAAQGVLLVYDVRNPQSFADLNRWWEELTLYCEWMAGAAGASSASPSPSGGATAKRTSITNTVTSTTAAGKAVGRTDGKAPILILCANKVDDTTSAGASGGSGSPTAPPRPRVVTEEQGRAWANAHGCAAYYETSASTEKNVKVAIEDLVVRVVAQFM